VLILLSGCLFYPDPVASTDSAPFYEGETLIQDVAWGCSAEKGTWTVEVSTQGWTGGGLISMSDDGYRFESHQLLTLRAAPDGTWEELRVVLDIEADPAMAVPGKSTAYLCNAETRAALAWRLAIYNPSGEGRADCRVWGEELDWNALAGYSPCDLWLE